MSRLSMELLKQEFSKFLKLLKSTGKKPNTELVPFGKYMSEHYNINDTSLEQELDHNLALLILMSKHVQKPEDKL